MIESARGSVFPEDSLLVFSIVRFRTSRPPAPPKIGPTFPLSRVPVSTPLLAICHNVGSGRRGRGPKEEARHEVSGDGEHRRVRRREGLAPRAKDCTLAGRESQTQMPQQDCTQQGRGTNQHSSPKRYVWYLKGNLQRQICEGESARSEKRGQPRHANSNINSGSGKHWQQQP